MTGTPSGRPGDPLNGDAGAAKRRIPTSRAYWNLRAEQILNRVFEREEPIDLTVAPAPSATTSTAPATATPAPAAEPIARPGPEHLRPVPPTALRPERPARPVRRRVGTAPPLPPRREPNLLLLAALGGVGALSAIGGLLYMNHWNQMQRSLSQERNLLLMERLRELGPATREGAAAGDAAADSGASPGAAPTAPSLPAPEGAQAAAAPPPAAGDEPPPPEEAWISDLERLPGGGQAGAPAPLRVPVSSRLGAQAPAARPLPAAPRPAAAPAPAGSGEVPQLVGVVAAPGRSGTAIFQVDGTSTSVAVGQGIGTSGWRLKATAGDSALIERGGEVRRLSIGGGY